VTSTPAAPNPATSNPASPFLRLGSPAAPFDAYLAAPELPLAEWKGAIIVIHEVWGLVDHITGIADRFAAEGYLALAPDLMGELAIDPAVAAELQVQLSAADTEERTAAQSRLRDLMAPVAVPAFATSALTKLIECIDFLEKQNGVEGRIGVVGFSFGGSYAFSLAVADSRIRASVPFYAYANFTNRLLAEISGPVLYFVGEDDVQLMDALPALTEQMRESGTRFTGIAYRKAGHAFFNDTNAAAYRADAAADSWKKTMDFFEEALSFPN
jgi:carboxymethylenebutenolidase